MFIMTKLSNNVYTYSVLYINIIKIILYIYMYGIYIIIYKTRHVCYVFFGVWDLFLVRMLQYMLTAITMGR